MERYSAMKRSEALTQATTWMNLENKMLSERSQAQKDTVLFCLGCRSKIPGWGLKQQKYISYSSGGQKSEIRVSGWSGSGEALFLVADGVFSLCPHMEEGARGLSGVSFIRTLIPFTVAPLS